MSVDRDSYYVDAGELKRLGFSEDIIQESLADSEKGILWIEPSCELVRKTIEVCCEVLLQREPGIAVPPMRPSYVTCSSRNLRRHVAALVGGFVVFGLLVSAGVYTATRMLDREVNRDAALAHVSRPSTEARPSPDPRLAFGWLPETDDLQAIIVVQATPKDDVLAGSGKVNVELVQDGTVLARNEISGSARETKVWFPLDVGHPNRNVKLMLSQSDDSAGWQVAVYSYFPNERRLADSKTVWLSKDRPAVEVDVSHSENGG